MNQLKEKARGPSKEGLQDRKTNYVHCMIKILKGLKDMTDTCGYKTKTMVIKKKTRHTWDGRRAREGKITIQNIHGLNVKQI